MANLEQIAVALEQRADTIKIVLGNIKDTKLTSEKYNPEPSTDHQNRLKIFHDNRGLNVNKVGTLESRYGLAVNEVDRESRLVNGLYDRTLTKTQFGVYLGKMVKQAEECIRDSSGSLREVYLDEFKFAKEANEEHNATPYVGDD